MRSKGFTLVELLVVIGIIAILAALLFPALQGALTRAKMVRTMNNGKQIYTALLSKELDYQASGSGTVYPKFNATMNAALMQFPTSTEYWKFGFTNNWFEGFDYTFFSAPGLDVPNATNTTLFASNHNAWCITAAVTDGDSSALPFVFTRNLLNSAPAAPLLSTVTGLDPTAPPYQDKGVVVVTKGGSGKVMKKDEMGTFNPSQSAKQYLIP
jgi:prepilin-type N-terminal cleavage/methylation domain-containing protein